MTRRPDDIARRGEGEHYGIHEDDSGWGVIKAILATAAAGVVAGTIAAVWLL